jgi:hypothetical protein
MLQTLEDAVFNKGKFPVEFYINDTHSRCMLALGAVSHKLIKEGKVVRARELINGIHSKLGLHGETFGKKSFVKFDFCVNSTCIFKCMMILCLIR